MWLTYFCNFEEQIDIDRQTRLNNLCHIDHNVWPKKPMISAPRFGPMQLHRQNYGTPAHFRQKHIVIDTIYQMRMYNDLIKIQFQNRLG